FLAIIANGDITAVGQGSVKASNGTDGFDILMIAGAQVSGPNNSPTLPGGTPSTGTVTFGLGNGGNIDFTGVSYPSNLNIFPISAPGSNNAGNVTLVAQANGATGGRILFPNISGAIDARGGMADGNVTIIAGAANGTAVSIPGDIFANSTSSKGTITIVTAQPATSNGGPLMG